MAISINWATRVIYVPKVDTTLLQSAPIEIRELNIDIFRLALKDLEDSEAGMMFPDTHVHYPGVTVGGVTLAMVINIINDYTITFEDGQYAVNLVGANSNVGDRINVNQVSVRSANSAGLTNNGTIELIRKLLQNRLELAEGFSNNWVLYDDNGVDILQVWNVTDKAGSAISFGSGVPARRSPV